MTSHWQAGSRIKHFIMTASDSEAVFLHSLRSALSSDIKVRTLIPSKVESEVEFKRLNEIRKFTQTGFPNNQSDIQLSCPP